ncbi:hypothetical protein Tco_0481518 [Tanacetum coccineum]
MTSDHNSSELGIHDHNNELSSSKLVPKVVPPADKTATSRQELELLFHHHITMLSHKVVRLGINPMIQPEPEDLPKDNPKLEIAVLRIHKDGDAMPLFPPAEVRIHYLHAHCSNTKTFYKHQADSRSKQTELKILNGKVFPTNSDIPRFFLQ